MPHLPCDVTQGSRLFNWNKWPLCTLLQEWWGVTDEVKAQSVSLSKRGGCGFKELVGFWIAGF